MAASDGSRPSLDELSTYFGRLTRKAALTGNVQTLRHSFITHMIDDGVPVPVVQLWAGHEDLETTMGYVSVTKDAAAHAKRARPLD